jgi:hypothetical protein
MRAAAGATRQQNTETGFIRRSDLSGWVARIAVNHDRDLRDCAAIARAISLAIRHRAPGDAIELDRVCELAKTTRREVLDAMNVMQRAGRLGVTPVRWEEPGTASEKWRPTAFHLTIGSAAEEAAREHAPRPAPLAASAYGGVEIERLAFGMRGALKRKAGCGSTPPVNTFSPAGIVADGSGEKAKLHTGGRAPMQGPGRKVDGRAPDRNLPITKRKPPILP